MSFKPDPFAENDWFSKIPPPKPFERKPAHERLFDPDDEVVVLNRDADEAGDYRVARRGDIWAGKWKGFYIVPGDPADLD